MLVRGQHAVDFPSQRFVASTRIIHNRSQSTHFALQNCLKEAIDLFPAFKALVNPSQRQEEVRRLKTQSSAPSAPRQPRRGH